MRTMVEFVRYVKGWEYIIAVGAVMTFILFWRLLSSDNKDKGTKKKNA